MLEVLAIALQLAAKFYAQSETARKANQPDWAKYTEAGAYTAAEGLRLLAEWKAAPSDRFDSMTPAEIVTLLTPPTWDELPV